jgi:hypothetical protein
MKNSLTNSEIKNCSLTYLVNLHVTYSNELKNIVKLKKAIEKELKNRNCDDILKM